MKVAGRAEVLHTIFVLLSFIAYHHASVSRETRWHYLGLSSLFTLLGCLAKETAIVILAINALYDLLYNYCLITDDSR